MSGCACLGLGIQVFLHMCSSRRVSCLYTKTASSDSEPSRWDFESPKSVEAFHPSVVLGFLGAQVDAAPRVEFIYSFMSATTPMGRMTDDSSTRQTMLSIDSLTCFQCHKYQHTYIAANVRNATARRTQRTPSADCPVILT